MMSRIASALLLTLALAAIPGFAQTRNQRPTGSQRAARQKLQTARLHIDGFMKSKSGAI